MLILLNLNLFDNLVTKANKTSEVLLLLIVHNNGASEMFWAKGLVQYLVDKLPIFHL
jgi:hypothetical protein